MNKELKTRLRRDRFEENKVYIRLPILVNIGFAIFLLVFNRESPYLWYALFSAILIFVINLYYNWRNPAINWFVSILYILIFLIEVYSIGIPSQALPHDNEMSKGIFMDILLGIIPFIYTGLRILSVIPLIIIAWLSNKLSKYSI